MAVRMKTAMMAAFRGVSMLTDGLRSRSLSVLSIDQVREEDC